VTLPANVAKFLACKRIAVAGVSHDPMQPANAIYRKLAAHGYEVFAVNPKGGDLEGKPAYPSLTAIPGSVEAVMVVTHPDVSAEVVREAARLGIQQVWFHRSFGDGSVSAAALAACRETALTPIVGGCPMMYLEPDVGHRCMRWVLNLSGKVPG
jgi:predicted CoA-binding protein